MDNSATSLWNALGEMNEDLADQPGFKARNYNILRMETEGSEFATAAKIRHAMDFKAQPKDAHLEMKADDLLDNDQDVAKALMDSALANENFDAQADKFVRQGYQQLAALKEVAKQAKRKESGVIAALTAPFHIWRICQQQRHEAEETMARMRDYAKRPKMDKAFLDQALAAKEINLVEYQLLEVDAATDEAFDEAVRKGELPSMEKLDLSYKFRQVQKRFLESSDREDEVQYPISLEERKAYRQLWVIKMQEVLASIDVLLTTCNNAASELFDQGFQAEVMMFDEAGQLTLQSMSVPLTRFKGYKLVLLFGDWHQLTPYTASGQMNEFYEYARMSVLEWLQFIGYPVMHLDIQYRMHPDICHFPNVKFYNGRLQNSPSTSLPNENREAFWKMTDAAIGKKSSYLVVNVQNGRSRGYLKTQSSCNHANVRAIITMLDQVIISGIAASEITILSYYRGQEQLTKQSLHEVYTRDHLTKLGQPHWNFADLTFKTPDTYQGSEKGIVFLDLVTAQKCHYDTLKKSFEIAKRQTGSPQDAQGAEEGLDDFLTSKTLTSYVRNKNRLCCSLTRAQDGLILFCHGPTMLSTKSKKKNSMSAQQLLWNLLYNARNRGVLYDDFTSMDTSEQATLEWENMTDQERDAEQKRREVLQDAYLHEF